MNSLACSGMERPISSVAANTATAMRENAVIIVSRVAAPPARAHFGPLERDDFSSNRHPALAYLVEHDLFRKPVSTFRDHALFPDAVGTLRQRVDAIEPFARGDVKHALVRSAERRVGGLARHLDGAEIFSRGIKNLNAGQ